MRYQSNKVFLLIYCFIKCHKIVTSEALFLPEIVKTSPVHCTYWRDSQAEWSGKIPGWSSPIPVLTGLDVA